MTYQLAVYPEESTPKTAWNWGSMI